MNKTHELKRMTNGYIGDDNVVREQFPVDANAYVSLQLDGICLGENQSIMNNIWIEIVTLDLFMYFFNDGLVN